MAQAAEINCFTVLGFPDSSVGKESACSAGNPGWIAGLGRSAGEGIGYTLQACGFPCGRPGFDPWVGKIPWRRKGLPTPVCWPGEFHGLCSPWGSKELDTNEGLSQFWSLEVQNQGVSKIASFCDDHEERICSRPFCSACGWLSSPCISTSSSLCVCIHVLSSRKDTDHIEWEPTVMTLF